MLNYVNLQKTKKKTIGAIIMRVFISQYGMMGGRVYPRRAADSWRTSEARVDGISVGARLVCRSQRESVL